MLRVRMLADRSTGERVAGYHPLTGERHLINPATGDPEPWPLVGVQIEGDTPQVCRVPTSFVDRGVAEGWIVLDNPRTVHRPGGPPEGQWRVTHSFTHADAVTLRCVDGDVRYKVVHQPDKYVAARDDSTPVTAEVYAAGGTRVDWFYDLEREG